MSEGQIDPEKALVALGKYGKYQLRIWFLSNLPSFYMAMQMLSMAFVNGKPEFYCSSEEQNATNRLISINWTHSTQKPNETCFISKFDSSVNSTVSFACGTGDTKFIYNNDFGSTIVTEWDLVCSRFFYSEFVGSIFMFGVMVGAMSMTQISDRFGRRWVFLICNWLFAVVSLGLAFTNSYISFAVIRFLSGVVNAGVGMVGFVISCEVIPASWRGYSTLLGCVNWVIGYVALGVIAIFVRDWRRLTVITAIPSFIGFTFYWFMPETLRWLVVNGKEKEAKEWINKAARYNGIAVDIDKIRTFESKDGNEIKRRHLLNICKSKILAVQALVMCYLWLCNAFVYYGLSLFSTRLSGDRYTSFILSGLVELPAYLTAVYTLEKFGRRTTAFVFHVVAGVALFLLIFVPTRSATGVNLAPLITTLSLIGKFSISCTFQAIFLYAAELYPTTVRTVGCGLSSTAARIGAILAPYVALLAEVNPALPPAIFGIMSLLAAALTGCLPETKGTELCNDIWDVRPGPLQRIALRLPKMEQEINNRKAKETNINLKELEALAKE